MPASEQDWSTEYLDFILSVKIVDSFDEAVQHIQKYSSGLTDAIVTENKIARSIPETRQRNGIVNASNRLTDGGVFGL